MCHGRAIRPIDSLISVLETKIGPAYASVDWQILRPAGELANPEADGKYTPFDSKTMGVPSADIMSAFRLTSKLYCSGLDVSESGMSAADREAGAGACGRSIGAPCARGPGTRPPRSTKMMLRAASGSIAFLDGLAAVVDTHVGAGGLKRLDQFVGPRFELPARDRRAHRRGHDSGGQDLVEAANRVSNLVRERHDVASGLGIVAIE